MAYFTNTIFYVDNTPTDRLWTCMLITHVSLDEVLDLLDLLGIRLLGQLARQFLALVRPYRVHKLVAVSKKLKRDREVRVGMIIITRGWRGQLAFWSNVPQRESNLGSLLLASLSINSPLTPTTSRNRATVRFADISRGRFWARINRC